MGVNNPLPLHPDLLFGDLLPITGSHFRIGEFQSCCEALLGLRRQRMRLGAAQQDFVSIEIPAVMIIKTQSVGIVHRHATVRVREEENVSVLDHNRSFGAEIDDEGFRLSGGPQTLVRLFMRTVQWLLGAGCGVPGHPVRPYEGTTIR